MPFDEAGAKAVVAALLDEAGGQVGRFVPVTDVIASSGIDASRAAAALDELAERRWVHIRSDRVAASKWGLEFAMDWTSAAVVLRAILNSGGTMDVLVAACGLPEHEIEKLLTELQPFGLAGYGLGKHENGPSIIRAYITGKGREYLNDGCKVPAFSWMRENDAPAMPDVWP